MSRRVWSWVEATDFGDQIESGSALAAMRCQRGVRLGPPVRISCAEPRHRGQVVHWLDGGSDASRLAEPWPPTWRLGSRHSLEPPE